MAVNTLNASFLNPRSTFMPIALAEQTELKVTA
jgi:hypothetical protein